ncbi:MAG: nucleoside kinase [Bacteroidales bacterium]|jgi:uridine kinase|nr:nucleoside kinase [Bacteroidales bacterium]
MQSIKIYCENTKIEKSYPFGSTLMDIIIDQKIEIGNPILGAMVNNTLKELDYLIYKPKTVRFIDYTHSDGKRMYMRSLSLVLFKATVDLYPNEKLKIKHTVSNGLYCELGRIIDENMHFEMINKLRNRMLEIINLDIPFERQEIRTEHALKIFEEFGLDDKCTLMHTRKQFYSSVYRFDDVVNYFYGYLLPSSGYLKNFDLIKYYEGMLLVAPKQKEPSKLPEIIIQNKLFEIFREFKEWVDIIGVPNVGQLNLATKNGKISEIIKISEALQEKKLASIADMINKRKENLKVIFISGPSSSGKTTFAKRLSIQLSVNGYTPIVLSMDNYFLDREHTPKDKDGEYDFESPLALDIKFFNENMLDLFDGKEVNLPKFSFSTGQRTFNGSQLKLEKNSIILVEGIHALNPIVSKMIPENRKFKVYVSALTPLSIDSSNRIPTTDNRLIRRMVRDSLYRGYSALETLKRWSSVRNGEAEHIFPYQEEADVMFNTALLFELGVLKRWVEPILKEVPPIVPEYSEARRLLKFLSYILPIAEKEIPPTSILREFLDGSSFDYS